MGISIRLSSKPLLSRSQEREEKGKKLRATCYEVSERVGRQDCLLADKNTKGISKAEKAKGECTAVHITVSQCRQCPTSSLSCALTS